MTNASHLRTYDPASSVVFRKTTEAYGGLSNMAAGFPLRVNGVRIRTSEALYQACRFPHMPEVQELIIGEASPMTAKMRSKPYRDRSREDWMAVRTRVMRWCLRVKLAQNWRAFSELLLKTADRPIVEYSRKDGFWGAQPQENGTLQGMNVLGRLLMELREQVRSTDADELRRVEPLPLENFCLFNRPIEPVGKDAHWESERSVREVPVQASLFDAPAPQEAPLPHKSLEASPATDALAPYPQMRPTGLDRPQYIPAHWEVQRIKSVLKEFDRRSGTGEEPLYSLRMQAGMVDHHKSGGKPIPPESLTHYKVVEAGDIVMNRMRAAMGLFGIAPETGLVSPDYATFHAVGEVHRPYLVQLFKTPMMAAQFRAESKGLGTGESGFLRLYTDRFGTIRIPLPPLDEQRGIVRVLDWHGAQVSRLVRAKRRLVGLLNEQKQAIIHRAVTRGLDETVPLKSSGIDWLGDIPAHWEVTALKRLCVESAVYGANISSDHYVSDGVRFLRTTDINEDGSINPYGVYLSASDAEPYMLSEKDFIVSRSGTVGLGMVYNEAIHGPCAHAGYLVRFSPNQSLLQSEFLWLFSKTKAFTSFLKSVSISSTIENVNGDKYANMSLPVPPLEEQEAILHRSRGAIRPIETLVTQIQSEIALIQEYRTRLIADVVTGQLDVRALAETLPDTSPDDLSADTDDEADDLTDEDETEDEEAAA